MVSKALQELIDMGDVEEVAPGIYDMTDKARAATGLSDHLLHRYEADSSLLTSPQSPC